MMIARAHYENDGGWGRGLHPYTIRVTRWSTGEWIAYIKSASAPKGETLIIDSDGGVIGGGSS